jgi:IS30 family transposase
MMNHRPRKTLGWRTPAEAMAETPPTTITDNQNEGDI